MLRRFILFLAVGTLGLGACAPVEPPSDPLSGGADVATATPLSPDQPVSATPLPPGATPPVVRPPYAPQPGDAALTRGSVFLDGHELLILESYPPQIVLRLSGSLPNPCHQLRVAVAPPDAQNRVQIEVYSLVDGSQVCIEVLKEFEQSVPLGSFSPGHYMVWLNGERIGEFDV